MTVRTKIEQLGAEDLARYRQLEAQREAYGANPAVFGKGEIESAMIAYWRFRGELAARFGIDDLKDWDVSTQTGLIYYED